MESGIGCRLIDSDGPGDCPMVSQSAIVGTKNLMLAVRVECGLAAFACGHTVSTDLMLARLRDISKILFASARRHLSHCRSSSSTSSSLA